MVRGFSRHEYAWLVDKRHQRVAYGDLDWQSSGLRHEGRCTIADDPNAPDMNLDLVLRVHESRSDTPTILLTMNGMHAARIDINGWHRFDGEKQARQATHMQYHEAGSDGPVSTLELPHHQFPRLATGVNVKYESELQLCFRASVAWLNIDVSGVRWTPLPFPGGA